MWRALITAVRNAEAELNLATPCQIYVDLPGPKIRVTDLSTEAAGTPVSLKVSVVDVVRIYRSQQFQGTVKEGATPVSIGITLPEPYHK